MPEESTQWLVELHEQQGSSTLYRLAVMLGAGERAKEVVHTCFFALHRRGHRVIDPNERIEFLQENVVHQARAVRGVEGTIALPPDKDGEYGRILDVIRALPLHLSEHLIVSHYLTRFGPELASIMRMTLRRSNRRLETALMTVHQALGATGSLEATAEEVMAALQSCARTIQAPQTDEFEAELAALPPRQRLRVSIGALVVIAMLALALGFTVATMTRAIIPRQEETSPEQPTASASPGEHALPALVLGVPVYYVGRSDGLLYPESRDLPSSGQLVRSALEAVFALAPMDPDLRSAWSPGQLLSVDVQGSYLTVDLSSSAYESLSGEDAAQAIDQVVYTANNLVGVPGLRVRFLADGGPPPSPFDQAEGYATYGLTPIAPVRIMSPKNLAQYPAGDIQIRGEVHPVYSRPQVAITDTRKGQVVLQKRADRSKQPNRQGWYEWTLTVSLPPGDYDITVAAGNETKNSASSFEENKLIHVE